VAIPGGRSGASEDRPSLVMYQPLTLRVIAYVAERGDGS
jgi:hypothetical protein